MERAMRRKRYARLWSGAIVTLEAFPLPASSLLIMLHPFGLRRNAGTGNLKPQLTRDILYCCLQENRRPLYELCLWPERPVCSHEKPAEDWAGPICCAAVRILRGRSVLAGIDGLNVGAR